MGLTPTGGVVMGTRSGDLDPGVMVYLVREKKSDAIALEELVDHRSGRLGVSGVGSDMRRLHEAAASNPDARLAIDVPISDPASRRRVLVLPSQEDAQIARHTWALCAKRPSGSRIEPAAGPTP